jgi:hypothetical protein
MYAMSEIRPEDGIYGLCSDEMIMERSVVSSDIQRYLIFSQITTARCSW